MWLRTMEQSCGAVMGLSLLGVPLLVLLIVLVLLFSVFAIIGVPPNPSTPAAQRARGAVRVVALILSQAMVVALVADVVNRQSAFYVSWGDLLGTTKITSTAFHGGSTTPLVAPTHERSLPRRLGGHFRAAGVWRTTAAHFWPKGAVITHDKYHETQVNFELRGQASGITGAVSVHLPWGWTPNPVRRYPFIEALGGFPGSTATIFKTLGVGRLFEKAMAAHFLRPAVVVGIQDHAVRDSECMNTAAGQWATWLTKDVPQWLVAHVGISTSRAERAVVGYSMGGWCANMLAVKYPQVFGASVSIGGYMRPSFDPPNPVKLTSTQVNAFNLPQVLWSAPPNVRMWVQTDSSDPISYASTIVLKRRPVRSPTSLTLLVTKGAGHNLRNLSYSLPIAIKWLRTVEPVFVPIGH